MKKTTQEMGIYTLSNKLAVGCLECPGCPSGRLPGRSANGHFFDHCASGRPPGRPGQAIGRPPGRSASTWELSAFSRSTARSTALLWLACARSSSTPVDRSGRPTPGLVDRQCLAGKF